MVFQNWPISRKLTAITMLTSFTVLVLTATAFTVYEVASHRAALTRALAARAAIVAEHSAPALAAHDPRAATQALAALRTDPHLEQGALYDLQGHLLAQYPAEPTSPAVPARPGPLGAGFAAGGVVCFEPVFEGNTLRGTVYLKSDTGLLYVRVRYFALIALVILCGAVLVAWGVSQLLQRNLCGRILALADTAHAVSQKGDFSLRAPTAGEDELGLLTEAFNQLLARVQESEQGRSFLSAIVQSTDAAIVGKDLTGKVLSWNPGAERMFGYTAAEMIGHSITRVLRPDGGPAEEQRILEAVRKGQVQQYETVRLHKDGTALDVALIVSPIRDARGVIIGASSIARNITAYKRAEEQIHLLNLDLERRVEKRTAELSAANKELEAFTYSVAHDLRAPLRHIDAFTRIIHEEFAASLPPEALQYLENICKGSRHMSQLVDDLLNLARVSRQELKRQPTDLNELLREVTAGLKAETQGRDIEWRFHPLPTLPSDSGLMKQVFVNLLSNAVKYTRPRPHAVIEVGCMQLDGGPTLYVRDNGVGFDMKYVDKLFGVFQRLHRADEFEGTGVGLATVDRIVRKHGGRVWAEGALDQGATFYIYLP